jgi:hypothetical protein
MLKASEVYMKTAAQTRRPRRGLTFKDVWMAMMETDRLMKEQSKETDRKFQETDRKFQETDRLIKENAAQQKDKAAQQKENAAQQKETDRKFQETDRLIKEVGRKQEETAREIKALTKNIGGLDHTQGKLMEELYAAQLWEKFDALGFSFSQGSRERTFFENGRKLAEVDIFLENGQYAMPVEIKTKLEIEHVNDHLERMAKIRAYMDHCGDKRALVGAIGGGIVPKQVLVYAQKKGLYVLVRSGGSTVVAEADKSFKAREWEAS